MKDIVNNTMWRIILRLDEPCLDVCIMALLEYVAWFVLRLVGVELDSLNPGPRSLLFLVNLHLALLEQLLKSRNSDRTFPFEGWHLVEPENCGGDQQ